MNWISRLLVLSLPVILMSCNAAPASSVSNMMDLRGSLIGSEDMPQGWSTEGPMNTGLEPERSRDSAGIAFFPIGVEQLTAKTEQDVYRFQQVEDAEADYVYAAKEYNGSETPPGWQFKSRTADESYVACRTYPNFSFPVCYWVARYDRIVVQLIAWLMPGRMTGPDMQQVVIRIDARMSELRRGK